MCSRYSNNARSAITTLPATSHKRHRHCTVRQLTVHGHIPIPSGVVQSKGLYTRIPLTKKLLLVPASAAAGTAEEVAGLSCAAGSCIGVIEAIGADYINGAFGGATENHGGWKSLSSESDDCDVPHIVGG